jgi:hypothetical protein
MPTLDALRARLAPTDPEGALRIVHLDDSGGILHVTPVAEGAHSADQLFARYLAGLVTDVGAAAALIVISRSDGRPLRTDRALWQAVSERVAAAPTQLLDLVIAAR